ncbi:MAG: hypothetical protein WA667_17280 [Candidatus Nitrosopolaris sp.]
MFDKLRELTNLEIEEIRKLHNAGKRQGWVDVKWVPMEDASRSTLTNTSEQVVHALNNTATQFAAHPSTIAASGLPIAVMFGFVPGLMMVALSLLYSVPIMK